MRTVQMPLEVDLNDDPSLQILNKNIVYDGMLNSVVHGDSLKLILKVPDESVDVIIADPPYNIKKNFGNNFDDLSLSDYIDWCDEWIGQCLRVLKPTGTMFVYGFSEVLAHLFVKINANKRWLVWHYTNKNVASSKFWQRSHESIICCWKENPVFNRDAVREPYTEGFLNGAAGKARKGTPGRYSRNGKETIYNAHESGALPRDVIKIPALAGGAGMTERWFYCETCEDIFLPKEISSHRDHYIVKHPTQKPQELTKKLILSCKPEEGGLVLIPFAGSGSECLVTRDLKMDFIGFEINPEFVMMANLHLSKPLA